MKRYICLLIAACTIMVSTAQNLRQRAGVQPVPGSDHRQTTDTVRTVKKQRVPSIVYSKWNKKQHGWFIPIGIISAKDASHRQCSFRFSHPDAKGRYLRMEAVDGYGNYSPGFMDPYILRTGHTTDTLYNKEWAEKIEKACIYDFVPDPISDQIVQERAYDADMNLVYIYSRTPIGTKDGRQQYVGSYRDFYGLPAEMRRNPGNSNFAYGTLVLLTEDRWGNDSIIEYMDARGVKKPNANGVAMEVYVADRDGRILRQQSHDADGRLTIDDSGNCGIEYIWDDDFNVSQAIYMDANWHPIRMPRRIQPTRIDGTVMHRNTYNRYGLCTEEAYYDTNCRPDTNLYGMHKTVNTINKHGVCIETKYVGLDGKLRMMPGSFSIATITPDSLGRPLETRWYDNRGKWVSSENGLCKYVLRYDSTGQEVYRAGYVSVGDSVLPLFISDHSVSGRTFELFNDGSTRTDSLDAAGRTILTEYHNAHGLPDHNMEYARRTAKYTDGVGRATTVITYYDADGHQTSVSDLTGASRGVHINDSIAHTEQRRQYSPDGSLFNIHTALLDSTDTRLIGQYDNNFIGITCRAGGINQMRYYRAMLDRTIKDATTIYGRDEFGEPDYLDGSNVIYYYQRIGSKTYTFFDENNRPISDCNALRDALPKVMSIEVTDSAAYRLGLLDNDIIVADGVYGNEPEDSVELLDFRGRWALACAMQPQEPRRMIVLRADTAARCYRPVVIDGVTGSPSDNGFLAHVRYLTKRQTARIRQAIAGLSPTDIPIVPQSGEHNMVFAVPDMYVNERQKPYPKEVTDPSVVLSLSIPDINMCWTMGEDVDTIYTILQSRRGMPGLLPPIEMRLTKDGRHVQTLTTRKNSMGVRFFSNNLSADTYQRFAPVAREAAEAAAQSMQAAVLPHKELRGTYYYNSEPGLDDHSALDIVINNDGTYSLTGSTLAELADVSGSVIKLRIDFVTAEPQRLSGRVISLSAHASYHCTDIINPPQGDIDELKSTVDNVLANPEYRDNWIDNITWTSPALTPILYLEPQPDGSLKARNTNGQLINFTKTK